MIDVFGTLYFVMLPWILPQQRGRVWTWGGKGRFTQSCLGTKEIGAIWFLGFAVCLYTCIFIFLSSVIFIYDVYMDSCPSVLGSNKHEVSSANLERSYRRAPKGAGDENSTASGAGICHRCLCGQTVDWEDLPLGFIGKMLKCYCVFLLHSYITYIM